MFTPRYLLPLLAVALLVSLTGALAQSDAAERRLSLLALDPAVSASAARLVAALAEADPVVRRTAARLLMSPAKPTAANVKLTLGNSDALAAREGALALPRLDAGAAMALIPVALKHTDPLVRQAGVLALVGMRPRSSTILSLLQQAEQDPSGDVAPLAQTAASSYYTVLQELPLPTTGWKFRPDKRQGGEAEQWFAVELNEADWVPIGIGKWWGEFGQPELKCGWYRLSWQPPARKGGTRFELHFDAVDENAWVWVNGKAVGQHALGTAGWDKPFGFDVTSVLRWDRPNQITVRVINDVGAGGIYQPVSLRVQALQP